jgi:hypothetical protein
VRAHRGYVLDDAQLDALAAYLREIGGDGAPAASVPGHGTGLRAQYFANVTLSGAPALTRLEAVNARWAGAPGPNLPASGFSVRWTGLLQAPASGSYRFQTTSSSGIRVSVDGERVIDRWADRTATTETSDTHWRSSPASGCGWWSTMRVTRPVAKCACAGARRAKPQFVTVPALRACMRTSGAASR